MIENFRRNIEILSKLKQHPKLINLSFQVEFCKARLDNCITIVFLEYTSPRPAKTSLFSVSCIIYNRLLL